MIGGAFWMTFCKKKVVLAQREFILSLPKMFIAEFVDHEGKRAKGKK